MKLIFHCIKNVHLDETVPWVQNSDTLINRATFRSKSLTLKSGAEDLWRELKDGWDEPLSACESRFKPKIEQTTAFSWFILNICNIVHKTRESPETETHIGVWFYEVNCSSSTKVHNASYVFLCYLYVFCVGRKTSPVFKGHTATNL